MKKKLKLLCLIMVAISYPSIFKAQIISTIAGTGVAGNSGDGGLAINAQFRAPAGIAMDQNGDIFVVERNNHQIRKIDISTGIITTIAGIGTPGNSGNGGLAINAQLIEPSNVSFDPQGNLYISGGADHGVRRIDMTTGIITSVAGIGIDGFSGDGGLATSAAFNRPTGVAWDSSGDLYIADSGNNRIRKVDAQTGIVSTFAGTGVSGDTGDGGAAIAAQFSYPSGLKMDKNGNLHICTHYRIRKIDLGTGIISTVVGTGIDGFSGDGGLAINAKINTARQVNFDIEGNIYIATDGHRVRKIDIVTGIISTIAGTGVFGFSGDGTTGSFEFVFSPISGDISDFLGNPTLSIIASGVNTFSELAGFSNGANGWDPLASNDTAIFTQSFSAHTF